MRPARSIDSAATSVRSCAIACARWFAMSACARSRISFASCSARAIRSRRTVLGRLARLLDDAARLVLGVGDLREVLRLLRLGLGLGLLRRLEVVADAVLAGLLHVLHGRHAELPHGHEQHQERERAPDDLVVLGLATATAPSGSRRPCSPPSASLSKHSSAASFANFGSAVGVVVCANAGAATINTATATPSDRDQCTNACTHV